MQQALFHIQNWLVMEDALFIIRRRDEQVCAPRGGNVLLLALDWAKAFDSIALKRLMDTLKRFGLNKSVLQAVGEIYQHRFSQQTSSVRPQNTRLKARSPASIHLSFSGWS